MLLRRIGFVISVIFWPYFTWMQLAVTFTFIQIMWNYLIYFYPMEDTFTNRMEIFSEITNLVLMYHVLLFTDFVSDVEIRYGIGFSFIGCMGVFISVHLFLMIKDTLHKCRDSARKRQKKKNDEEALLRQRTVRMEHYKAKVERARTQNHGKQNKSEKFLARLNEVVDIEEIAGLSLEEFENMKD